MALAREPSTDRDRAKSGLKLVFPFICGSISLRKMSRPVLLVAPNRNYTIFEGTSEIQRLIIARAISGVQIK
jgi:hypothetical protein